MPIIGHPSFSQGLLLTEYKNLRSLNLENAAKFVVTGRWSSMSELTKDSSLFQLPCWSAAKIHHFLHTIPNHQKFTRPLTTYEEYCSGTDHLPQVLFKAYSLLNSPQEQPCLPGIVKWESELHRAFTPKQKENIVNRQYAQKYKRLILKYSIGGISHPVDYTQSSLKHQISAGDVKKKRERC